MSDAYLVRGDKYKNIEITLDTTVSEKDLREGAEFLDAVTGRILNMGQTKYCLAKPETLDPYLNTPCLLPYIALVRHRGVAEYPATDPRNEEVEALHHTLHECSPYVFGEGVERDHKLDLWDKVRDKYAIPSLISAASIIAVGVVNGYISHACISPGKRGMAALALWGYFLACPEKVLLDRRT